MAVYKEDIVDIELESGSIHRSFLNHTIGSGDDDANRFGIRAFRNGSPENLAGSCNGYFIRADGETVVISTGTISGNVAYVTLPTACYAVEGQFALAIKVSSGGATTTMRIIDGVVSRTTTDVIVDPGTIVPSVEELIDAIDAAVASLPADYSSLNGYMKDIVMMESGTFSDSDGVTHVSNTARQRNKVPLYMDKIAGIIIPEGYEMYVFYLDDSLEIIGRSTDTWYTDYFNAFVATSGTKYINFAIRNADNPSSDISDDDIRPTIIWKNAEKVIPRWNINTGGIYIDGNDVVVNENGFGIIIGEKRYYIAPVDQETVTTFTPSNVGYPYALVIDKTLLTTSGRNEPSTVMKIVSIEDKNINTDRYITVAFYFEKKWNFIGEFIYFSSVDIMPKDIDYCTWNNARGGIRIDGSSIVLNANGFCVAYNSHPYYIAPTDMESTTTFTPPSLTSTYLLVIDPAKLTNPGGRQNPSDVMSIVPYFGTTYSKSYIVVATFYKGVWEFVGKFLYFNKSTDSEVVNSVGHVSQYFLESHIIAHKGGSAAEENTIANFKAAAAAGFKAVEADIRYTSDGVMVLSHDASFTINGTTYVIAQNTYADLVAVKPNLATFEELLILCKRTNMVIDVDFTKEYSTEQTAALYDMIVKYGATSRCLITCYEATARQLLNNQPMPICISQVTTTQAVDAIADIIAQSSICFCSIYYNNATKALMSYMHEAGALTKVWTVDSADTAVTQLGNGADMIISNSLTDSTITNV